MSGKHFFQCLFGSFVSASVVPSVCLFGLLSEHFPHELVSLVVVLLEEKWHTKKDVSWCFGRNLVKRDCCCLCLAHLDLLLNHPLIVNL